MARVFTRAGDVGDAELRCLRRSHGLKTRATIRVIVTRRPRTLHLQVKEETMSSVNDRLVFVASPAAPVAAAVEQEEINAAKSDGGD
jgi:hypothetical protein